MKATPARKVASRVAGWLVVLVCAVALYERAAATPQPMQPDDLARATRKVASDAVEASRLSRSLAIGQVTEHFARTQLEQLSQDLAGVREKLDAPPPPGGAQDAQHVRDAAQRLERSLQAVPHHMADGDTMVRFEQQQGSIARELGASGGSGS